MKKPYAIHKVAVLGAGVMGAQIAAHCVNAGMETLLFDLKSKEGSSDELVNKAIAHLNTLKPAPLAMLEYGQCIQARNYEEDLDDLGQCDFVIEAIAERMDFKESLYRKITPYLRKDAILASNTSGLSINTLASVLPEEHRAHFCGVHFFNPPRYMHLAELIPAQTTDPSLLDYLETWLTRYLGKGVVRAKDTPNFIGNRVGVFSLLATMHHAEAMDLSLDEVDALTGTLLGRPKSATFRTVDVVGLDTMEHVVHTMQDQLKNDPWHAFFNLPPWMLKMIEDGHLGQKTGQGIYRKNGNTIEVYDRLSGGYQPAKAEVDKTILAIMKIPDLSERMRQLMTSSHKQAKFLVACYRDLFHYCAYHLEGIADTVRDVDLAIRWGFGWRQGPFETWQLSGLSMMLDLIETSKNKKETLSQAELPGWLKSLAWFYTSDGAYAPSQNNYAPRRALPVYQRQFFPDPVLNENPLTKSVLFENEGVLLWHLRDDVAVMSFKTKANIINQAVLDGLEQGIDKAEKECQGMIVYQSDANNFSSGADLRSVFSLIQAKKTSQLEAMVKQFQVVNMRLKYSSIPTVGALRGRALGGGCELLMHCSAIVAAFESYPGLVETGVGLLPAGGGCKEMALRAAIKSQEADLLSFLQPFFQRIATGYVSANAVDAIQKGFIKGQDHWLMHTDEVLYAALNQVKLMQTMNYLAPFKSSIKVAGREGFARIKAGLVNWLEGKFISEHDYFVAEHIANVLCGGDINQGQVVDEQWFLDRELEAFMLLASTPLTQARIENFLETGKPLRN